MLHPGGNQQLRYIKNFEKLKQTLQIVKKNKIHILNYLVCFFLLLVMKKL